MKKNLRSWEIDIKGFDETSDRDALAQFLIRFAVIAPSSHNSQPWKFEIMETGIAVIENTERALPESDPERRQQMVSIGAAVENIVIAGNYFGKQPSVSIAAINPFRVHITLHDDNRGVVRSDEHLIHRITQRSTNRSPYDVSRRIPAEIVSEILSLHEEGVRAVCVTDKIQVESIAEVVLSATDDAMQRKAFRVELAEYIKPTGTSSALGMPGNTIEVPALLSYFLPSLIRMTAPGKSVRDKLKQLLIEQTGTFIIIFAEGDTPADRLSAGRLYERIALHLSAREIGTHPLAAAIEIGNYHDLLTSIIGASGRPLFFCRVGYPIKCAPHSPRLSLADMLLVYPS